MDNPTDLSRNTCFRNVFADEPTLTPEEYTPLYTLYVAFPITAWLTALIGALNMTSTHGADAAFLYSG